jgi:hypothetical protein
LSQPPYYPSSGQPGGAYAPPAPQPAAAPPPQQPAAPQPAAPTQIAYPGQVQLPPAPQYAPPPQAQVQSGPFATGFPNYRPPAPSPKNRTGLIVGILVVLAVVIFAVLGFWLVS